MVKTGNIFIGYSLEMQEAFLDSRFQLYFCTTKIRDNCKY